MKNDQSLHSTPASGQVSEFLDRQAKGDIRHFVFGPGLLLLAFVLVIGSMAALLMGGHLSGFASHRNLSVQTHHPLTLSTSQAAPIPAPAEQNSALVSQVNTLFTRQVKQDQFSGSVLIAQDGQVLFKKGYGMADWTHHIPNTPHTKFHVGSLTKQFTAMALMILQERGRLHVHDALCRYLPHCPAAWRPLTIHHLLTHTSGIPQLDDPHVSLASVQAFLVSYDGVPLSFAPGSQYNYCSICFQILGIVVQQASGQPYSTFVQQAILGPLHMHDSGFDVHYLSLPDHAVGYASWRVAADSLGWDVGPSMSFLDASGLLYTTVEDLYRWDQSFYADTLVSQKTLDEIYTPYVASEFPSSAYGYGWFITKAPATHNPVFWHYGSINGFRAYIGRYPSEKVTIIVLSNLATEDIIALAGAVEHTVFASINTTESGAAGTRLCACAGPPGAPIP